MQICKNLAKLGVKYLRYVFLVFFSFYFSILYGACVKLELITNRVHIKTGSLIFHCNTQACNYCIFHPVAVSKPR